MPKTKASARVGLVLLVMVGLLAVPLATGVLAPSPAAYAQIEFTPNVATLVITPTPQGATIGPLVYHEGDRFQCVGLGGVMGGTDCRPAVVAVHGDDRFGWGEMVGYPGLVLVWITDETGTQFLIVSADDPQFAGLAGGDSFADMIGDREEQIQYIRDREWEIAGSVVAPGGLIVALLLLCPETAGTTCLLAGIGAAATGLGNIVRNAGMEADAQDRLSRIEDNLAGRFQQMVLTITTPP
jgi:hypothetical protein